MITQSDIDKEWEELKNYEDALKRKQKELTKLIEKLKTKTLNIDVVVVRSEHLIAFLDWFVDPEQNNLNFNSSKEYIDVYLKGN